MRDSFLDIEYWRRLAPHFSIGKKVKVAPFPLREEQEKALDGRMVKEGYVHLAQPGFRASFEKLAALFDLLASEGLPPVFSFVFDELWNLNRQLSHFIATLLQGDYAMLPNFWAWRVLPGESGWKPHRDKISGCLFPDRRPKSITVWIPITEAHPLNGCMYALPADRDEEYALENSTRGVGEWSDIRALPAKAGDLLAWTQHLYHWGGHAADDHSLPPRMSVAFEYQRKDVRPFKTPLLDPEGSWSLEERLSLIAKQVLQYQHMYKLSPRLEELTRAIGKRA